MKKLFASYMFRGVLAYALLAVIGYALTHAQPSWLGNGGFVQGGRGAASAPPPPANAVIKTKTVERVRYDTITVIKVDTIVRVDTLHPPKPVYYVYTVWYEILDKNLAMGKSFSWDFSRTAQKTTLQSSDTTLLNLGNEVLRESSYTYDNNGNKTQTYEKLIEGLDMRVAGKRANITYRTGSSLLALDGLFDSFGLLQLSSDFSRRRYFLYFIPIDFLFGSEKYTLFLRIEKSEVR
jgi:hypothetical protein